ncbi:MAG TPA: tRNA-dihydrouridine synthase, partial [Sphaerochaeta sp.]|nr:tRNA-dihydrouridine synthase [Sphaerochaeta sp.]
KEYCIQGGYDVPVFGSGDLFHPGDAQKMLQETGIDGVMFARGAMGNPFIFRQAREILQGGEASPILLSERIATILRHLDLMIDYYGEKSACTQMRKHTCSYLKGVANAAPIKAVVVQANTREDYLEAMQTLQASC